MGFAVENMAKGASSQKYVGQKYVGAVEAAVTILRYLAGQSSPHGVAAIARATDLNISTTFNILRTLCKDDLVAFDAVQKSYRIGMGVLEFSAPLIGGNQVDVMRPVLERLAARHRVLIGLWQITADERIVLLDRVVDQGIVRADMSLGSRLPAYAGAIGRVYAASRDLSRAQLRAKFKTLRWDSAPRFEDYAADVMVAKATGHARDAGQLFRSLDIAAAVVVDCSSRARFGISGITIKGQKTAPEMQALAVAIRDDARMISQRMFGGGPTLAPPQHDGSQLKPPLKGSPHHEHDRKPPGTRGAVSRLS